MKRAIGPCLAVAAIGCAAASCANKLAAPSPAVPPPAGRDRVEHEERRCARDNAVDSPRAAPGDPRPAAGAGPKRPRHQVPAHILRKEQQVMISLTGIDDLQTMRTEYYRPDGTRLFPELPIYEGRDFVDGLAHVKLLERRGTRGHLQSCLIDTQGEVVLRLPDHLWPMVLYGRLVSEGLIVVWDMHTNRFGYMSLAGDMVYPARFLEAAPFFGGTARVKTDEGEKVLER